MFLLYTGRRLEKNTRKPQDTTKTFKFDTTRNLLYWENKLEGISDDGAEHTNAEHGCGRRVFPAALHIGRGGLTLTKKKKIATDTHDAPKLLNRRLDLRVECATSENAPPVKVNGTPHQFYASTCVKPFGYAPYIEFSHIQYSLFTSAPDLKKNIRKPQDTTKTFKFDTTRNLLY